MAANFFLCYYSLIGAPICKSLSSMGYGVIPLTPADCHSTGESKEMVKEVQRERESNSCLKRSSVVLGRSSLTVPGLDSDVIVRDSLDRKPPFEGNRSCLTDEL